MKENGDRRKNIIMKGMRGGEEEIKEKVENMERFGNSYWGDRDKENRVE